MAIEITRSRRGSAPDWKGERPFRQFPPSADFQNMCVTLSVAVYAASTAPPMLVCASACVRERNSSGINSGLEGSPTLDRFSSRSRARQY